MPKIIEKPTIIKAAGTKPKEISEYIGRVNTGQTSISIARMVSPPGWEEPGQQPEFEEYTLILKGALKVEHRDGVATINAGEAIITHAGEWVRYSTPNANGAEYIAVCNPAFSQEKVHRDP